MDKRPTAKQVAAGCRHFTGLQHNQCAAGLFYRHPLPCLPDHLSGEVVGECEKREWRTEAELDERKRLSDAAIKQYFDDLQRNICPHCGAAIESREQVGRCVYARPCGCRLYQGRLD